MITFNRLPLLTITFIACLSLFILECHANEVAPVGPRKVHSANGVYVFDITPAEQYLKHPGHCLGELYKNEAGRRQRVWSRFLINNTAPADVFVSDSGKYVATIDEWDIGSMVPLVIYGENGRLIHVHTHESLGLANDKEAGERATVTGDDSDARWDEDSIVFFGPEDKTIIIRLRWGKTLIVDALDLLCGGRADPALVRDAFSSAVML